jgi:ribosomal protein S10
MLVKKILVLIKIETTHLEILRSKIYFINKFCNIYNIIFTNYTNKKKICKFSLLKSPHIHKKTWRKYNKRSYIIHYKLTIYNNKYLIYLYILLKTLTANSRISCKYITK